jgi:hypothetical protein
VIVRVSAFCSFFELIDLMSLCHPVTSDSDFFSEDYGLGGRAIGGADVFQVKYPTKAQQDYALKHRVYRLAIDLSALRTGATHVVVSSEDGNQSKRTWPVGLAIGVAGLAEALRSA